MRIICFSENQLNLDKMQKMQQKINILEEKIEVVKEDVKRKAEGKYKILPKLFYAYLMKVKKNQLITDKD